MTAVKRNLGKNWQWVLLIVLLAFLMAPTIAAAEEGNDADPGEVADVVDDDKNTYDDDKDAYDDDKDAYDDDDDMDDEGPAFQNPAQAQKAENLAHAATRNTDDKELAERVENAEDAEQELAEARERLANLPEDATEEERREAIRDVRQARRDVREARRSVAERLSEISGEYKADITRMREAGYGWGEIAKELGVHPSALGLGHKKGHKKGYRHTHTVRNRHQAGKRGDLSAATRRDVKNGWGARGHGKSVAGKGRGRGQASANGFDRDDAGGKGKGKGNGRGGRGGGRGGGQGGGNGRGGGNGNGQGGGNGRR
jgi:hypothetical protein